MAGLPTKGTEQMTRHGVWAAAVVAAFLGLLSAPAAGQSEPPLPEADEAKQPLGPVAIAKVQAFVRYYADRIKAVDQLKSTEDCDKIRVAREGLLKGYARHETAFFQSEFAAAAAEQLTPLLASPDPAKQVQVAIALAAMPQPPIQPALEAMARHPNEGVQYYAVRGYRMVGRALMTQSGNYAKLMLATLERLGAQSGSGALLGGVFRALVPWPDARKDEAAAAAAMLGTMQKVWLARTRDILGGKDEIIAAYQRTLAPLRSVEVADNKPIIQMLADLMEAGTTALLNHQDPKDQTTAALVLLVGSAESRLVELVPGTQALVQRILANDRKKFEERTMEARLAFNNVWKKALEGQKIKPGPLPAPASVPATSTAPVSPAK